MSLAQSLSMLPKPASGGGVPGYITTLVTDWASRVIAAGGADPSSPTKTAITNFLIAVDSIYDDLINVNVFAPDSLAAALTPIIKKFGTDTWANDAFEAEFVSGDLSVNGLAGDGTKYLKTGVNPSLCFPDVLSAGLSLYAKVSSETAEFDFGCQTAGDSFVLYYAYSDTTYWDCWNSGEGRISGPSSGFTGFISANRIGDDQALFRASSTVPHEVFASSNTPGTYARPNLDCWIFTMNDTDTPAAACAKTFSFAAIHKGLTEAKSLLLYNAVQQLRTDFGGGYV